MTRIIAFHLPQFHTFPENDEWWGKGFTEWVNVKKAKPFYKGHIQPKQPLNDNYYNLLDRETIKWQADLAKKYGIYGFCYYHYWFNGKLLMEKPLELLLEEKEINIPFCFCWANEPWTRAWDGGKKDVIMPQYYGKEKEWEEHFRYLLKFFRDKRYIKEKNAPMLILYRTNNIPNCDEMIEFWDRRCRDNGFDGIYVVEERNSFQKYPACHNSKAVLEFEPSYTQRYGRNIFSYKLERLKFKIGSGLFSRNYFLISYDQIWKKIISRKISPLHGKPVYPGAFVSWDNSPRRAYGAKIFKGFTPEKFESYLNRQMRKAEMGNCDFLFINAWNEWAEGAYLEPDSVNGYQCLEAVKKAVEIKKS